MELGTKEKILHEAQQLVYMNGFRATSVDAIAKASGVKKANVFYYFPTKEALGLELLDRMATYILDNMLAPIFADDRHPAEQIRDYIRLIRTGLEEGNCQGGCPLGNMALEMADVDEDFRTRLVRFFEELGSLIEGALQRGLEKGLYRDTLDPSATAAFIVSSVQGAIMLAKTKREPEALAHAETQLVTLLESYQE